MVQITEDVDHRCCSLSLTRNEGRRIQSAHSCRGQQVAGVPGSAPHSNTIRKVTSFAYTIESQQWEREKIVRTKNNQNTYIYNENYIGCGVNNAVS
jgi:hypothetical protein